MYGENKNFPFVLRFIFFNQLTAKGLPKDRERVVFSEQIYVIKSNKLRVIITAKKL